MYCEHGGNAMFVDELMPIHEIGRLWRHESELCQNSIFQIDGID